MIWGAYDAETGHGYGLAHIAALHPEVVPDLPERLARMEVASIVERGRPDERIVLRSPNGA